MKIINKKYILVTVLGFALTSCSDFTEIQPKGTNLLETTDQLELLLNYQYGYDSALGTTDMMELCGDIIEYYGNVNNLFSQPQNNLYQIRLGWDEERHVKFSAELTSHDVFYNECYSIIGRISNSILDRVEVAQGLQGDKARLKSEALVLRAYFHYLLVQKYAKAYNPSTAASEPGIIYETETLDIKKAAPKSTLEEVYQCILKDIDDAIATGGLPEKNINRMRMSLPCAYAIKALALMSMQNYSGAEEAAKRALDICNTVVDYNTMTVSVPATNYFKLTQALCRPKQQCEEDYFNVDNINYYNWITPYATSMFEEGHASYYKLLFRKGTTLGLPGTWIRTNDLDSSWNNVGLKTTQMYLVLAECAINRGDIDMAMEYLDVIRVKRIDSSVYTPLKGIVNDKVTAINKLKMTSHGENVYTMYNFINRKRWTQVEDYKETFTRNLGDKNMSLTPTSKLWVFPFPRSVKAVNPNIKDNY